MIFGQRRLKRPDLAIRGERLLLRPPLPDDFRAWAALRTESRAFLQPWEPTWPADDLTRGAYRRRIARYEEEIGRDEAYPFFVFAVADGRLLGGLNLTNVRRGAASMASLGYWMGHQHAGRGVMTEAVTMLAPFAARRLGLRRIEAACLPENKASLRLLEKAQFVREGYAREYLAIDGVWRDHILFARIAGPHEDSKG
jgi:[ribosomal protein S5]-alanine N-acetyltransferase